MVLYDVSFTATVSSVSASVAVGDVACGDGTGNNFSLATAAALAAPNAGIVFGVFTTPAIAGGVSQVQFSGYVSPAVTGLGAGDLSLVTVNSSGRMVRGSDANTMGVCDALGGVLLMPGAGFGSSGFTPGGDLDGDAVTQEVVGFRTKPVSSDPPFTYQVYQYDGSQWVATTPAIVSIGGDLGGGPFSQLVVGIRGVPVVSTPPTAGQVLTYDDGLEKAVWATPGSGFTAGGDLTGTPTSQTVSKLQTITLVVGTPGDGQVLAYNAGLTRIEFITPSTGSFTAGGDLTGSDTSQTVSKIQTIPIDVSSPVNGQALIYNSVSGAIELTTLSTGSFTAGGDLSGSDVIQTVEKIQGSVIDMSFGGGPANGDYLAFDGILSKWHPRSFAGDVGYVGPSDQLLVQGIQGYSFDSDPAPGQVPTFNGANMTWGSSGTAVTWANDLATSTSTSQNVVKLTGSGGVVTVPSAALTFGSNVASTGTLRFANNKPAYARNSGNSADRLLFNMSSFDILQLGDTGNSSTQVSGGTVSLLSSTNTVTLSSSLNLINTDLTFTGGTSLRTFKYAAQTSDSAVGAMLVKGQDAFASASVNVDGGHLGITSGAGKPGGSGTHGHTFLGIGDTTPYLDVADLAALSAGSRRRAIGLGAPISTTQIPFQADRVLYVPVTTTPSAGSPSGGWILWADSEGLWARNPSGTTFSLT